MVGGGEKEEEKEEEEGEADGVLGVGSTTSCLTYQATRLSQFQYGSILV